MRLMIVALLALGCSMAPIPSVPAPPTPSPFSTPTGTPAPTPTPTPTLTPSPLPAPEAAFGDGTWRVPVDVSPGTYRTTTFTSDCYWTRLRGFDSGLRDLIASNIGSGYQVVTIGPRDAGIDSVSCGAWTADLRPATDLATEFGEGTYIVGTDIEAGAYAAPDVTSCSWLRLSGFGFARRDIIARGFANDGLTVIVEISATDAGFSSSGCGTWTRVALLL